MWYKVSVIYHENEIMIFGDKSFQIFENLHKKQILDGRMMP